ncbi:unnamed protein product [Brassicogethes aeneus]|uniref:Fanconi anemia group M protein n=1 Tax=Brassicogethes aeneus TaxID=1431903 RepID=A0A9P0AY08_BRAAE|nr:unnamed protein product [Brassicogethes aeneus]
MSSTSKRISCIELSKDLETEGFDHQAGQTWIYPTNYPMRDYQYNIIQQALLKNTLVSLPTGLGKTFIAAVVMYNFYRWYPHGKIIFMAPTRPLVKQQVDACYDIMGIPKEVTAEITGSKVSSSSRGNIWTEKRVFFITPHVLQNDLDSLDDLANQIKCIVFDEAHKARGNYAYCEVIRKLENKNKYFRVLALSATPGSNINDIVEVANSLLISRLEFRTEESPDVVPYVFNRNIETVVVPLNSKLLEVKEKYLQILEYYTKVLIKYRIINGNYGNLSKGRIFLIMKDFQQKQRGTGNSNYGEIMKSLNICVTLYHAFELLIRHGLRSFLSFYEEHIDKPLLRGNAGIIELMNDIRQYLGPAPNMEQLPDGSYSELSPLTKFGHPKYYKLKDILMEHFGKANNSRVIVFFEYRESVMEAYAMLLQAKPLVQPRIFLGQGYGVTQRVQINVIKAFREGSCNTLLSTCIGEEGLDVGEVDLILCFDISNASPIRMIQRMGRTGRKQEGNIFFLVTEGKEQDTLKQCLIQKQNLQNYVLASKELSNSLKKDSPRLVPEGVVPRCEKMYITVKKPVLSKNSSIKDMFRSISSGSSTPVFSQNLEMKDFEEKIPKSFTLWNKENPMSVEVKPKSIYSKHIEKQRTLQPIHKISHSKSSKFLVDLFQFADSKRYNISTTQMPGMSSTQTELKNMKQGDIRSMFFKPTVRTTQEDPILGQISAPSQSTLLENAIVDIISNEVFDEISSYLLIENSAQKTCKHCPGNFDCTKFATPAEEINLSSWMQPCSSIFDKITVDHLDRFLDSLSPKSVIDLDEFGDQDVGESFFDVDTSIVETKSTKAESSFVFAAPKTLRNILNRFSKSIISQSYLNEQRGEDVSSNDLKEKINVSTEFLEDFNEASFNSDFNLSHSNKKNNATQSSEVSLKLNSSIQKHNFVDDFDDTSFNCNKQNMVDDFKQTNEETKIDHQEILSFFKLTKLEDLYEIENDDNDNDTQDTIIYSPSSPLNIIPKTPEENFIDCLSPVISYSQRTNRSNNNLTQISSSPVLSFKNKSRVLSMKKRKINFSALFNGVEENTPKCLFTPNSTPTSKTVVDIVDDLDDLCDLSEFNITKTTLTHAEKKIQEEETSLSGTQTSKTLDDEIDDFCDLSDFNISINNLKQIENQIITTKQQENSILSSTHFNNTDSNITRRKKNKNQPEDIFESLNEIDDICDLSVFGIAEKPPTEDKDDLGDFFDLSTFGLSQKPSTSKKESPLKSPVLSLARKDSSSQSHLALTQRRKQDMSSQLQLTITSQRKKENPSQSQLAITQMLSLISKEQKSSSQKENIPNSSILDDLANFQEFNFSFNTKKPATPRSKLGAIKNTQPPKNKTPLKSRLECTMNDTAISISSDDDFEPKTINSKKKKICKMPIKSPPKKSTVENKGKCKKKKKKSGFLLTQAELSDDEDIIVSDDEDDSDNDVYDKSFVDSQEIISNTQMHANYLQSIRSPVRPGQFKIPQRPKQNISNVFSQFVDMENDTYLHDSFCVNTEDVDCPQHDLSELEILELKLKEKRKNKKRKSSENTKGATKRRRIIQILSDSD